MAVTHQDIQYLQKNTKDFSTDSSQKEIINTDTGQKFQIIDRMEGVTQAIAVAPLDANGEPIVSQTIVTVAGTQQFLPTLSVQTIGLQLTMPLEEVPTEMG